MEAVDLLIKGGTVVSQSRKLEKQWIAVKDGKIAATGIGETYPEAKKAIDATGKYVLPGAIDCEAHTAQPVVKHIPAETRAAIASGTTTMGIQPNSNRLVKDPPAINKPEDMPSWLVAIPEFIDLMKNNSWFDYFMIPNLNNEWMLKEVPEMATKLGASFFKLTLHCHGGERLWAMWGNLGAKRGDFYYDDGMVFQLMRQVVELGPPSKLALHCENWDIARVLKQDLIKAKRKDMAAWGDHSPDFLEAGYVRNYAYYAKITGCPLFIMHTTTRKTIEEVKKARADGVRIIANVEPQYATFDRNVGSINVPVRPSEDREAVWEALKNGTINTVSTDSVWQIIRPLENVEKDGVIPPPGDPFDWSKTFFNGCSGFMLPVMLSEGVNKNRISLERLVEVCCENPAKTWGIYPKKGVIAPGSDADFVIVDLNRTKKVTRDMVFALVGWSAYEGWELKGWPVMTILRGNVVMEWPDGAPNRKLIGDPFGTYIPVYPGGKDYLVT
ncbi:MAG: amidohydrolase family protein [Chloroflexi bacterium]|nr:amidohydrolase family protein [Chloroflexota bacterium]